MIGTERNELEILTILEHYYCQQYLHLLLTSLEGLTHASSVQRQLLSVQTDPLRRSCRLQS